MNELVSLVSQKTGISEENALKAVETVMGFLKSRLPAGLSGQLDSLVAGDKAGLGDALKNAPNVLGGMLGNK